MLDLVARYNWAIDHGEADAWAACFTADGVFESGPSSVTATGTAELAEFARGFAARSAGVRHWVSNVAVEGTGDEASLRCYLLLVDTRNAPPSLLRAAEYDDRLRRVDGAWRFTHRRVA